MSTESFRISYEDAIKRNKTLPYEEKLEIWSHCKRDWGNGTNEIQPYIPFKAAEKVHKSKARFVIPVAGNRFSKSTLMAMEAVACMCVPGTKTWIVGPLYKVCDNEWDYVYHAIVKTDVWNIVIKGIIKKQLIKMFKEKRLERKYIDTDKFGNDFIMWDKINFERKYRKIHNGHPKHIIIDYPDAPPAVIEQLAYVKTDWSGLEGAKISLMIFAEGSRVPAMLFERHFRMRLSDMDGRVFISCTPKGRDGFLYPAFQKGASYKLMVDINRDKREVYAYNKPVEKSKYHVDNAVSYSDSYESFQFPAYENPYYNMKEYEAQKNALFDNQLDESIFRERIFGTFESLTGNYFMGINEDKVFVKSFPLPEECTIYRGIDPGRQKACALWVAVQPWENGKFRYIIFRELYEPNLYLEKLCKTVIEMSAEDVYYTAIDPESEYRKFSNKLPVLNRMKECGIEPLYCPHNLPRDNMTRFDLWLPDMRDARVIVFKDKCPNYVQEVQEAEFADPIQTEGHTIEQKRLIKGDRHALTAFTYLRWMNPQYIERAVIEKKKHEKKKGLEPIPHMSLAAALKERETVANQGLLGMIN